MADKNQYILLAQLCAELEQYHDEYTLKSTAYGHTLDGGFELLSHLVTDVVSHLPEYADESEVVNECRDYLEYYTKPPHHVLASER